MGFFKNLFEKKECSLCGGEIGLLGNRKLEDGNCCKNCAGKLSPWFDDRRHSTVDQIKAQLAYREENRVALEGFQPTVCFGEYYTLRAELVQGVPSRFVVESQDYASENADLIAFKDVTSFEIEVDEDERELTYSNKEGKEVSYNPPRYEYSYDFYAKILVDNPYFDDIRFRLNNDTIILETVSSRQILIKNFNKANFDPMLYPEYRQQKKECDDLEALFKAGMDGTTLDGQVPDLPVTAAPEQIEQTTDNPKFCPNCGAANEGGKFCQYCGMKF